MHLYFFLSIFIYTETFSDQGLFSVNIVILSLISKIYLCLISHLCLYLEYTNKILNQCFYRYWLLFHFVLYDNSLKLIVDELDGMGWDGIRRDQKYTNIIISNRKHDTKVRSQIHVIQHYI